MDTLINNTPNWAEQLEAWATLGGAIFAFVGIILAWISIRKQISEQKDNINTLTGVVSTLSKQAEALGRQTEALSESMKIDSKILSELTNHFAHTVEIDKLNQEKENLSFMPILRKNRAGGDNDNYKVSFINYGGLAYIKEILYDKNIGFDLELLTHENDPIANNEEFEIHFIRNSGNWGAKFSFQIIYYDYKKEKKYSQSVEYNAGNYRNLEFKEVIDFKAGFID